jgi:hypothetical protein
MMDTSMPKWGAAGITRGLDEEQRATQGWRFVTQGALSGLRALPVTMDPREFRKNIPYEEG